MEIFHYYIGTWNKPSRCLVNSFRDTNHARAFCTQIDKNDNYFANRVGEKISNKCFENLLVKFLFYSMVSDSIFNERVFCTQIDPN